MLCIFSLLRLGGKSEATLHHSPPAHSHPSQHLAFSSVNPFPWPPSPHSSLPPHIQHFQHTHNLADKLLELSQDAREHQNKLRPLWRSAPYCSPRCDVTFVQQPRVGHGYGGERGTLGEPACHALATSLAAPEISHCRDLVPADSHPPPHVAGLWTHPEVALPAAHRTYT